MASNRSHKYRVKTRKQLTIRFFFLFCWCLHFYRLFRVLFFVFNLRILNILTESTLNGSWSHVVTTFPNRLVFIRHSIHFEFEYFLFTFVIAGCSSVCALLSFDQWRIYMAEEKKTTRRNAWVFIVVECWNRGSASVIWSLGHRSCSFFFISHFWRNEIPL